MQMREFLANTAGCPIHRALAMSGIAIVSLAGASIIGRMAPRKLQLDEKQTALIARALADPRRFQILKKIGSQDSCPNCELLSCQEVGAATISHHVKELEVAGLIDAVREGKNVRFVLRRDVLKAYTQQLASI
jgi:ArsR family transcriptional regulator, arsenate/arsenite/antimonite-responsive transcriptional repressor